MKTFAKYLFSVMALLLVFYSCEQEDNSKPPEIPPLATMVIDFGNFSGLTKSANENMTKTAWTVSAAVVNLWGIIMTTTLAVPVASFVEAFDQTPVKTDEGKWEWTYTVPGFTSTYTAQLLGEVRSDVIQWEMYITREGVDPFEKFLWFEGTSAKDGTSGQWKLNHSPGFPEELLLINWKKEGDKVNEIRYTYTRELTDDRKADPFYGSFLYYGLESTLPFDAFVNLHFYDNTKKKFSDVFIEWNTTSFSGRIKAENFYNDTNWHCWDSSGNDSVCP